VAKGGTAPGDGCTNEVVAARADIAALKAANMERVTASFWELLCEASDRGLRMPAIPGKKRR
jgi:hypothetical protein